MIMSVCVSIHVCVKKKCQKLLIFGGSLPSDPGMMMMMMMMMMMISKFNGTSTPKGSYSAKTGESTSLRKEWYGSTV